MKKFVNKSGFSIAEAMITLLIVSIALAAAAPIMSRSEKSSIENQTKINNIVNSLWQKDTKGIHYNEGNVGIGSNSDVGEYKLIVKTNPEKGIAKFSEGTKHIVTFGQNGRLRLIPHTNEKEINAREDGQLATFAIQHVPGGAYFFAIYYDGTLKIFPRDIQADGPNNQKNPAIILSPDGSIVIDSQSEEKKAALIIKQNSTTKRVFYNDGTDKQF